MVPSAMASSRHALSAGQLGPELALPTRWMHGNGASPSDVLSEPRMTEALQKRRREVRPIGKAMQIKGRLRPYLWSWQQSHPAA